MQEPFLEPEAEEDAFLYGEETHFRELQPLSSFEEQDCGYEGTVRSRRESNTSTVAGMAVGNDEERKRGLDLVAEGERSTQRGDNSIGTRYVTILVRFFIRR